MPPAETSSASDLDELNDLGPGAAASAGATRIFLPPTAFQFEKDQEKEGGQAISQDPAISHQLRHVLRLKSGHHVNLLDGLGNIWSAQIASMERNLVIFQGLRLLPGLEGSKKKALQIVSFLPLIKAHRFEWALEKLTEIGVNKIIPFATSRTVVKTKADDRSRQKRWQQIIKEAAEQSENLTMPEIAVPLSLAQALKNLPVSLANEKRMLLSERSQAPDMVHHLALANCSVDIQVSSSGGASPLNKIVLIVGPEGGFSTEEISLIVESNFQAASMGDTILRSETAAILAAGIALAIGSSLD